VGAGRGLPGGWTRGVVSLTPLLGNRRGRRRGAAGATQGFRWLGPVVTSFGAAVGKPARGRGLAFGDHRSEVRVGVTSGSDGGAPQDEQDVYPHGHLEATMAQAMGALGVGHRPTQTRGE